MSRKAPEQDIDESALSTHDPKDHAAGVKAVMVSLSRSWEQMGAGRTITDEQSVSTLAGDYDMSFAAVQKHVAVLEAAGLIIKRAEGRERLVRADPAMIARARALLARYEEMWRARIDRLDALLSEDPSPEPIAHEGD